MSTGATVHPLRYAGYTTGLLSTARDAAHFGVFISYPTGEYCPAQGDVRCARTAATTISSALAKLPPDPGMEETRQLMSISVAMLNASILAHMGAPAARTRLAEVDSLPTHTS